MILQPAFPATIRFPCPVAGDSGKSLDGMSKVSRQPPALP